MLNTQISEKGKIQFLDGLRGIAILTVVLWHAYGSTYADYLPYGCKYCVPVQLFWVGVQLFFMISGFVILMTLEKCSSVLEFAVRRWFRLFPAMLVASILILAFDRAFAIGPYANRSLINLLPGILFIDPSIIHTVTGVMIESMDGPFWSLYVEVSFYAIFGTAYFIFGAKKAIVGIFALFLITYISSVLVIGGFGGSLFARIIAAMRWLGFIEFGWFASGAMLYVYTRNVHSHDHDWKVFALAVAFGLTSALTAGLFKSGLFNYGILEKVALVSVVVIVATSVRSPWLQSKLASPFLLFFGFVSYPLYLLHNNMILGLTKWISDSLQHPAIYIITPVIPFFLVTGISWIIASYIEPAFRMLRPRRNAAGLPEKL